MLSAPGCFRRRPPGFSFFALPLIPASFHIASTSLPDFHSAISRRNFHPGAGVSAFHHAFIRLLLIWPGSGLWPGIPGSSSSPGVRVGPGLALALCVLLHFAGIPARLMILRYSIDIQPPIRHVRLVCRYSLITGPLAAIQ